MSDTDEITPPGDDATPEEVDDFRAKMAEKNLKAAGVATVTKIPVDYFGTDETEQTFLPDGVSYIEHKTLTEGDRRKYLNKTNRGVEVIKATGNARMSLAPGDERFELLKMAIVDWNLKSGGQDVKFTPTNLDKFLDKANPKVVDVIEKAVRLANPWLLAEVSLEDLKKERQTLDDLIAKKEQEEEGKAA